MTPTQYARAWQRRARDYGPAMKAEVRAIGDLALSLSNRLMTQEIYSKPETIGPKGRPLWRRTNYLAVSEHLETNDGERIVLVNEASYGEPRHEANKPGRRQIDPARTAHWRNDMLLIMDREIPERIRRLQLAILRET